MATPKKTIQEIKRISVMDSVLKDTLQGDYFAATAPDTWNDDEKRMYDMLCDVENRVINKVLEILSNPAQKNK